MPDFTILVNEITIDPLSRGYDSMSDQAVADDLNTAYRDNWVTLESAEIFEAIHPTEFLALTSAQQGRVDRILGLGGRIRTAPGSKARDELIALFGGGSTTISNLASIANQMQTRAAEIGWAGAVEAIDVNRARTL